MLHIREVTIEDASILALLGRVTYTESHGHFIESKTHLLNYLDEAFSIQKIKKDILKETHSRGPDVRFVVVAASADHLWGNPESRPNHTLQQLSVLGEMRG